MGFVPPKKEPLFSLLPLVRDAVPLVSYVTGNAVRQRPLIAVTHEVLYCVKRSMSEYEAMLPQVWKIHCKCETVSAWVRLWVHGWDCECMGETVSAWVRLWVRGWDCECMGVRINFSRRGNVEILLILFRLLTIPCKWTSTKRLILSTPLDCDGWTSILNLVPEMFSTLRLSIMLFPFVNCLISIFSSTFYKNVII